MGLYNMCYCGSEFENEINFRKILGDKLVDDINIVTYGGIPKYADGNHIERFFNDIRSNNDIWDNVSLDVRYCKYRDIYYINDIFINTIISHKKHVGVDQIINKITPKLIFLKLFYQITKIYSLNYMKIEDMTPIIRFDGITSYIRDAMYRLALNMRKRIKYRHAHKKLPKVFTVKYSYKLYDYKPHITDNACSSSLFQKILTSNNAKIEEYMEKFIQKILKTVHELTLTERYPLSEIKYDITNNLEITLNTKIKDLSTLDFNVIQNISIPKKIRSNINESLNIFDFNYDCYNLKRPTWFTPYIGEWFDNDLTGENTIPKIIFPPQVKERMYSLIEIVFNTFNISRYIGYNDDVLTSLQLLNLLNTLH